MIVRDWLWMPLVPAGLFTLVARALHRVAPRPPPVSRALAACTAMYAGGLAPLGPSMVPPQWWIELERP